jgi:DNA (cytosine-5)-methyltransferase 1
MKKIQDSESFTFADLFAGIGGFHIGLSKIGGKCLYACEIDAFARKTYQNNFAITPLEDITKLEPKNLPYVDVITFGFPCQDLSSIGTRKGLEDGTRSSLVYDALDIVIEKKPKVFIAENVKGLLSHDKGRTFADLLNYMKEFVGYSVYAQVLNSRDFEVPQNRERVYIIGIRKDIDDGKFTFPAPTGRLKNMKGFLEKNVESKYTLSDHLLKNYIYKVDDGRPYVVTENSEYSRTLNTSYHKIQRLTGTFVDVDGWRIRKLTPREFYNLQGFPSNFKITVSDTQAYRQAGNAVTVKVVEEIGKKLLAYLDITKNNISVKIKTTKSNIENFTI